MESTIHIFGYIGKFYLACLWASAIWVGGAYVANRIRPFHLADNERSYWSGMFAGLFVIPVVYLGYQISPWPSYNIITNVATNHWALAGIGGIIVLGFIYRLACLIYRNIRLKKSLQTKTSPADEALNALFREEAEKAEVDPASFTVLVSKEYSVPFAVTKHIVLPQQLVNTTTESNLRRIAKHEIIHLKYEDPKWMQFVNRGMLFYFANPFAWWTRRKLILAMETLADVPLTKESSERVEYSKLLLEMATNITNLPCITATSILGQKSIFRERVERLLERDDGPYHHYLKTRIVLITWSLICITIMFVTPLFP